MQNLKTTNTIRISQIGMKMYKQEALHFKFIGDSITAGTSKMGTVKYQSLRKNGDEITYLTYQNTYVSTSMQILQAKFYGDLSENLTYSKYGFPAFSLDDYIKVGLNEDKADLAIIAFGINDSRLQPDLEQFYNNLCHVVEHEIKAGSAVVLLSIPSRRKRASNLAPYRQIIQLVAQTYNCPFFDSEQATCLYSANAYVDNTHLSELGQINFGKSLAAFIASLAGANKAVTSHLQLCQNEEISNLDYSLRAKHPNAPGIARNIKQNGDVCASYIKLANKMCYYITFYNERAHNLVIPVLRLSEGASVLIYGHDGLNTYNNWWTKKTASHKAAVSFGEYRDAHRFDTKVAVDKKINTDNLILLPESGWYTLKVEASTKADSYVQLYGLEFIEENVYLRLTNQEKTRVVDH